MSDMQMPDGITEIDNGQDSSENKPSKETLNLISSLGTMARSIGKQVSKFTESVTDNIAPKLEQVGEQLKSATTKTFSSALTAGLGPLNLLTGVIKDISGFDLQEKITSGFSGMFSTLNPFKPTKKTPKPSDVAKKGDAGSLLLFNFFKSKEGKGDDEKGGLLSGLLGGGIGGAVAKALPLLLKGGAIAAIIGSLLWAVADGIKGINLADEWGTSKVSGFIGGFLGGTESGWKGAFKNGGKWALMGAGAGFLVAGPVGALVGGLIGLAIGGILGFIGGEKIAKGLDKFGKWVKDAWNTVINGLKVFFQGVGQLFSNIWSGVQRFFNNPAEALRAWIVEPIGGAISTIWEKLPLNEGLRNFLETWIINPVTTVFDTIWDFAEDFFDNPLQALEDWVFDPLSNIFRGFGDFIFENTPDWLKTSERKQAESLLGAQGTSSQRQGLMDWVNANLRGGEEVTSEVELIRMLKNNPELLNRARFGAEQFGFRSVDDAIIKDNMIIEPSPDDTLIATKNPITNLGGMTGGGSSEVITLLRELINAVREQDLNVNIPTDFDRYRGQDIREF